MCRLQTSSRLAYPAAARAIRSLALLAAMHRAGNRSPGALTCAKLGSFVHRIVASSTMHRASQWRLGPAVKSGAFFVATSLPSKIEARS